MQKHPLRLRNFAVVIGAAVLAFSGWASADPPSRVARLGYMTGEISFSPAGENDWVHATINRPLTTGDRLWADAGARAEIQIGGAMIRMNAGTSLSVLNLDDRIVQLQLTQGTLNVRVRRFEPNQVLEVDTPNLAFTLRQPGEYRIMVDADGNATEIVVRKGQGEVYGEGASYVVDSRQPYRFTGTGLSEYQYVDAPRLDEFDRWSSDRDRSYDNSGSARYVSQDVVGYQDLDANGTWRVDAAYGNVWIPTRVAADWAPYRDGHWAWVDPWGWTWVDDAPWGFAVSHYGRWANMHGTWGWIPGPVRTRAYYAPALVAFVGGSNFQLVIGSGNVGGVAWFPLGPREVYRPSYAVSRGYFENVNRSNTVVNNTVINNYYNNSNVTNVVYANRQVPGAVVAVPTATFVQSQPVGRAVVKVAPAMLASAPVAIVPSVAPTERSVRGAASSGDKPPARVFERPVVARTAPPAASVGFAAQQQQLAAKPGKPLDDTARRELKPAAAAPAPVVKVVTPTQIAPPTARPPPATVTAKPGDARGKSDERNVPSAAPAAPLPSAAPPHAPPQRVAPIPAASPQVAPPATIAQPPEQRGRPEQPGKGEQRGSPAAAPPTSAPRAAPSPLVPPQPAPPMAPPLVVPTPAAPPQVAPPVTIAQPPEQRGKSEQRAQPVPPQPTPKQGVAQPQIAPPQAASPASAAQLPESRGKSEQRGEQRGQPVAPPPSPPRTIEPKPAPVQVAPAPPAMQTPPQRVAPASVAPLRQVAPTVPPAPPAQQPAKPEPAPAAKPPESRPPAAAQPQPAPSAQPRGQESKPAAGKPDDKKKDSDEQKREEELRKQKG